MRWLTFGVLAVIAVSLQTTVAPRMIWYGLSPDWVLVLVVFYCLHARSDHAVLAGWLAGALADLMTLERFGLVSLSYGLTALLVCGVRDLVFTRHPLTHFTVTLFAALGVQVLWMVYRMLVGLPVGSSLCLVGSSIYTALWAPLLHAVLLKAPRLLGIRPRQYSYVRLLSSGGPGV
jgi:rod shape-determining protein MreD